MDASNISETPVYINQFIFKWN